MTTTTYEAGLSRVEFDLLLRRAVFGSSASCGGAVPRHDAVLLLAA